MKTEHTEAKTVKAPSVGSGDLLAIIPIFARGFDDDAKAYDDDGYFEAAKISRHHAQQMRVIFAGLSAIRAGNARGFEPYSDGARVKHLVELPLTETEYAAFRLLLANAEMSHAPKNH